jgi:hypothetical protein
MSLSRLSPCQSPYCFQTRSWRSCGCGRCACVRWGCAKARSLSCWGWSTRRSAAGGPPTLRVACRRGLVTAQAARQPLDAGSLRTRPLTSNSSSTTTLPSDLSIPRTVASPSRPRPDPRRVRCPPGGPPSASALSAEATPSRGPAPRPESKIPRRSKSSCGRPTWRWKPEQTKLRQRCNDHNTAYSTAKSTYISAPFTSCAACTTGLYGLPGKACTRTSSSASINLRPCYRPECTSG